jgi:hypothetical protein
MMMLELTLDNGTRINYTMTYGKMTDTVSINVPAIGTAVIAGHSIRDLFEGLEQMGFHVKKGKQ